MDLDTICMKAIDKDPDRRYQTAGQLSQDLRNYGNRYAISARRIGPVGYAEKLARRNLLAPSFLSFAIVVLTISGIVWSSSRRAKIDLVKAEIVYLAMRGEFDKARNLLQKWQSSLGMGWRGLLDGQILLYEGSSEIEANDTLRNAAQSLPDDPVANSLLAISFFLSGREDEYILHQRQF